MLPRDNKAYFWLAGLTALALGTCMGLDGREGILMGLVLVATLDVAIFALWEPVVIAASGGTRLRYAEVPQFYAFVRDLCKRAGMPVPQTYVLPSPGIQVQVIGHDPRRMALLLSEGALDLLHEGKARDALRQTIAHGLAHVRQHDGWWATVGSLILGVLTQFAAIFALDTLLGLDERSVAHGLALTVVAPLAATLLNLALLHFQEAEAEHLGQMIVTHGLIPQPVTTGPLPVAEPKPAPPARPPIQQRNNTLATGPVGQQRIPATSAAMARPSTGSQSGAFHQRIKAS